MKKIEEAQAILEALGVPRAQRNEISALTLLALAGIEPGTAWKKATKKSLGVSKGIMAFIFDKYGKNYAPNTRETVRRQVLHQFVQARIADYNPDAPALPVNSPRAHYAISDVALQVVRAYGSPKWKKEVKWFVDHVGTLQEKYLGKRKYDLVPVTLSDGTELFLSAGKHNEVQAAVIQEFAPRFAPGAQVLYLGDTAKKDFLLNVEVLKQMGVPMDNHSKLPDLVIYDAKKRWLYLIEVVTSHGPMSPKRMVELEKLFSECDAGTIYVTAFPDYSEFKKHINEIAWETEVWIAEIPDHLIHFNGDRFMGPRNV
jgi:hypothetical protein